MAYLRDFNNIKCAESAISLIKKYNEQGKSLDHINNHSEIGSLVCKIVADNYGLGIRILFDSGLDMTVAHPVTGDTALIIVCNEGLCGPVKQLIEKLPPNSLSHANKLGHTALTQLLVRAHGSCGCLEKLLCSTKLDPTILPESLVKAKFPQNQSSSNNNQDLCNIESERTIQTIPVLIFLSELVRRIRSSDPQRILSVVQLWIKGNILRLHGLTEHEQHENLYCIEERLIKELSRPSNDNLVRSSVTNNKNDLLNNFKSILVSLIILGQLNERTALTKLCDATSSDGEGLHEMLADLAQSLSNPLPLRFLVLRRIRQLIQGHLINQCLKPTEDQSNYCEDNHVLVFSQWIQTLPLPKILIQFIILETVNFQF